MKHKKTNRTCTDWNVACITTRKSSKHYKPYTDNITREECDKVQEKNELIFFICIPSDFARKYSFCAPGLLYYLYNDNISSILLLICILL